MPNENAKSKQEKLLCVDNLRHAEYYGMQKVFDDLYARSKNGEEFTDLMTVILSRENILLAYRNIKTNAGSKTAGTDGLTIAVSSICPACPHIACGRLWTKIFCPQKIAIFRVSRVWEGKKKCSQS